MNMAQNRHIKIGFWVCLLVALMAVGWRNKSHDDSYVMRQRDTGKIYPATASPRTTALRAMRLWRIKAYLALGDSYTIGQSVAVSDRYPVQAAALLSEKDAPEVIARTGWTTGDLLDALTANPPSRPVYHVVTLLIGVNNQFQGRPVAEYRTQFTELLRRCIHWTGDTASHVIVLSIPDYGDSFYGQQAGDPAAVSKGIDAFNAVNLEVSGAYGVRYVDITDLTRSAKGDATLFAPDGLHYSGKEMALWAERLVKAWP